MRQIKFRYIFKHKVFNNFSLYHFTLEEIEKGAFAKVLNSGMIENGYELVSRDQYTDSKDKNAKEIYEKDIVKSTMDEIFKVEFAEDFSGFVATATSLRMGIGQNAHIFKVIGNAVENPELLEVK